MGFQNYEENEDFCLQVKLAQENNTPDTFTAIDPCAF